MLQTLFFVVFCVIKTALHTVLLWSNHIFKKEMSW